MKFFRNCVKLYIINKIYFMYHDKCTFWAPQNPTHTAAVRVEEDAAFCDYFGGNVVGEEKSCIFAVQWIAGVNLLTPYNKTS